MIPALKQTAYGCKVEDRMVVLYVGDKAITMDYDTALRMSSFLHHAGKEAKRNAGDHSRYLIGLGTLTDANMDELKAQKSRDGTVSFVGASVQ